MKIEIYRDEDEVISDPPQPPAPKPADKPISDDPKPVKKDNTGLLIAIVVIAIIVIANVIYFYGKSKEE